METSFLIAQTILNILSKLDGNVSISLWYIVSVMTNWRNPCFNYINIKCWRSDRPWHVAPCTLLLQPVLPLKVYQPQYKILSQWPRAVLLLLFWPPFAGQCGPPAVEVTLDHMLSESPYCRGNNFTLNHISGFKLWLPIKISWGTFKNTHPSPFLRFISFFRGHLA